MKKSGGKCWYCGCDLRGKWHVDHCEAIYRYEDGPWKPENDTLRNMVPACPKCNLFKSVFNIEEFRHELQMQVARARRSSVNFRTAERFGQIRVIEQPIVFWFERQK